MTDWNLTFTMNKCLCLSYGNKGYRIICNRWGKEIRVQIWWITAFLPLPEIKLRQSVGGWQTPDKHIGVLASVMLPGPWEPFKHAWFHFINGIISEEKKTCTRSLTTRVASPCLRQFILLILIERLNMLFLHLSLIIFSKSSRQNAIFTPLPKTFCLMLHNGCSYSSKLHSLIQS